MADYNNMSQHDYQQIFEAGGAPRMTITHSQSSYGSQPSEFSDMATKYSAPSPITNPSCYDTSHYQEEPNYSSTRKSQYGDYDTGVFQQYGNSHLALSNPSGLSPYNHWSPPAPPIVTQHLPAGAYQDNHMHATYQTPSESTRHTIKSLRWDLDTSYLEGERFYRFVVNKGKDPWYQLIDPSHESPWTPFRVYLADPFPSSQKSFPCAHPFPATYANKKPTCPKPFGRRADLERHYLHVHKPALSKEPSPAMSPSPLPETSTNDRAKARQEGDIFICDRRNCNRDKDYPLERKDHFRDHLRDFHKEDLGKEKVKKDVSKEVQAERQRAWEAERVINPKRWRCNKCLMNNIVRIDGWKCGGFGCKVVCEDKRRQVRERMIEEQKRSDEDVVIMDMKLGDERVCNTCFGSGRYYDVACPDCGPDCVRDDDADAQGLVVEYGQLFEAEMGMFDGAGYTA